MRESALTDQRRQNPWQLERHIDGSMGMGMMRKAEGESRRVKAGGLAGWLLARLRVSRPQPSLALLERITLAPRQSLALIEAEGRRFLVATSADGSPAFLALDNRTRATVSPRGSTQPRARVSW